MKTLLLGGDVWFADRTVKKDCAVLWEDGTILAVGDACNGVMPDHIVNATGMTVIPGLIDVHTHGRAGYDFCTANVEEMKKMKLKLYLALGVGLAIIALVLIGGWLLR